MLERWEAEDMKKVDMLGLTWYIILLGGPFGEIYKQIGGRSNYFEIIIPNAKQKHKNYTPKRWVGQRSTIRDWKPDAGRPREVHRFVPPLMAVRRIQQPRNSAAWRWDHSLRASSEGWDCSAGENLVMIVGTRRSTDALWLQSPEKPFKSDYCESCRFMCFLLLFAFSFSSGICDTHVLLRLNLRSRPKIST